MHVLSSIDRGEECRFFNPSSIVSRSFKAVFVQSSCRIANCANM